MSHVVRLLSENSGLSESVVRKIILSAPLRYKTYYIPKRSGGFRQIAQPAREVKLLQRVFIETTLQHLPVHEAATAYRKGSSILDNAKRHVNSGPIIKMDFSNFFPSIKSVDWAKYCRANSAITEQEDIELTSRLLFKNSPGSHKLELAIGAPSSPILSNILMFEFDRVISGLVDQDFVIYTRYADDLTFSAKRTGYLHDVIKHVTSAIRLLDFPKLSINESKTTYVTKKYHRIVTGLTLSDDGRVTIGRTNKRTLSAAVHRATKNMLNIGDLQMLAGYIAFVNSVEPDFLSKLERKYGNDIIRRIKNNGIIMKRILPYKN